MINSRNDKAGPTEQESRLVVGHPKIESLFKSLHCLLHLLIAYLGGIFMRPNRSRLPEDFRCWHFWNATAMMQHGHALDSTLNVKLVVTLWWLNLGLELGLTRQMLDLFQVYANKEHSVIYRALRACSTSTKSIIMPVVMSEMGLLGCS